MKNTLKTFKDMNAQANGVANTMRNQQAPDSLIPTWLVDIYKKSGISSVVVNLK